jgi:hypothetical protein
MPHILEFLQTKKELRLIYLIAHYMENFYGSLSGNAVWGSAPAIDPIKKLVYIATGNNYEVNFYILLIGISIIIILKFY